jgi:hypothetical protein
VMSMVQGFVRCDARSLVRYHTQIYKPVYGATTHENCTTMRAYMVRPHVVCGKV